MLGNMEILIQEDLWNAAVERRMAERAQKEGADEKANFALDAVDAQAAQWVLHILWHHMQQHRSGNGWTLKEFAALKAPEDSEEKDPLALLTKAVDSFVTLGAISRKHYRMGVQTRDFDPGRSYFENLFGFHERENFIGFPIAADSADLVWLMAMERMDSAAYMQAAAKLPEKMCERLLMWGYIENARFADLPRYIETYMDFAKDHPQSWMTPQFHMDLTAFMVSRISTAMGKDDEDKNEKPQSLFNPLLTTQSDGYTLNDIQATHGMKLFGDRAEEYLKEENAQQANPAKIAWREHWKNIVEAAKFLIGQNGAIPKEWEGLTWTRNFARTPADDDMRCGDQYWVFDIKKQEKPPKTAAKPTKPGVMAAIWARFGKIRGA